MANLRVDKITSTETFERTGSVQFGGSGDYLSLASSSDFGFGTGDFTIEAWVCPRQVSNNPYIYEPRTSAAQNVAAPIIYIYNNNIIYASNMTNLITGKEINDNTWFHVAVVRHQSVTTLYADGVNQGSINDTRDYIDSPVLIGMRKNTTGQSLNGFISNLRVIKGKAVYTADFKVPMKELEATPETVLLCCQSKTSAAAAKVSPNISGVNDGTIWSDALDVTNGGRLRHEDYGDSSTHSPSLIFDGDTSTDAEGPNGTNNNIIYDFQTLLGKSIPVSSSIKIVIGGSDGRTLKVNGSTIGTNLGSTVQTITSQSALNKIEVVAESSSRSGRLADIKVDDVSLLLPVLPFGRNINASELSPGLLTDKVIDGGSSAIKGSVEFDGDSDGLVLSKSTDFQFGTGDFTIEGWFNVSDTGAIRTLFDSRNTDTVTHGLFVGINSNDNLYTYGFPGGTGVVNYGIPKHGEWHHFAVVRNGSDGYVFLNGVKVSGSIDTSSTNYIHQGATVGQPSTVFAETLYRYKGFISNLRIVKGTALYTHDFIPPTRELKKVPGTVLLCCQDPDNPLTEATGKTITPYGDLGDGSLGGELVTNNSVWTLAKGGSGATDWTVSNNGRSLAGTTVSGGYIRATYTLSKGDYLVSLRWTGGNFAVQDSTGYIVATDGTDTEFSSSEDGAYSFYMTATTSVVITGTSWSTAYTVDDISIKRIYRNNGASNFTPQVGDNRKVTFDGVTKINSDAYFYLPTGDTITRDSRSGRGISLGGAPSPSTARSEVIDYITISSMGNSQDFGNLTVARSLNGGCSSSTRGICAGGYNEPVSTPGYLDTIDYITIAATGNAVDFGNLTVARNGLSGTSNSTRGVFAGGSKPPSDTKENVIDYLTIASLGNAINFGDLSQEKRNTGCTGSAIRAIWAGGQVGPTITTVMDYVTIASTGHAADFGDLTANRRHCIGSSSSTRGIFAGGTTNPTLIDIIEYITMSSTGNSNDFGNLTDARSEFGGPSNKIRAVFMGGWDSPTYDNRIDYITIATTGNASDFGNLGGGVRGAMAGISDSHGGLG